MTTAYGNSKPWTSPPSRFQIAKIEIAMDFNKYEHGSNSSVPVNCWFTTEIDRFVGPLGLQFWSIPSSPKHMSTTCEMGKSNLSQLGPTKQGCISIHQAKNGATQQVWMILHSFFLVKLLFNRPSLSYCRPTFSLDDIEFLSLDDPTRSNPLPSMIIHKLIVH